MSLIEALVTVMVLGTLAAVAYAFLSGVTDSAHTEKARNDVASLNRAVEIFVSNGGSIDPEASAEEVIALLKGHASTEQADYHVGLSGSKIDPRLTPVPVSALESDTPGTRIRWDGSAHRFTVEDDATGPGISAFVLVDNAAENGDHQIQLSDGVFTYAKEDTWIWDYQDAVATPLVGPSTIPTTAPPADTLPPPSSGGTPPAAVPPGPPSPPVAAKLDPPLFSIAAGKHPLKDFRLSLTLSDPNTAGAGKIRYRLISGAAWEDYEEREALMIDPDDKVDAFVESNSPAEYENSVVAGASYWTDPVTLALNVTADKSGVTYYDLTENAVYARAIVTNLDEIPAHLQSAGLFEILWSGSPSSGGGVLLDAEKDSGSGESLVRLGTGLWNNTPDLVLQSIAKADGSPWVKSSATETLSLTAVSLPLPPPDVSTVDIGDGKFQVSMSHTGKVPPGAAIYFNLAGESPASTPGAGLPANATRYSGPFLWEPDDDGSTGSGSATVLATAFPPASLGLWFDPSPPAAATVALPPTNKADGGPYALVKESMVLDGTVIGNIRNLNAAGI
ncbi:MAG: hypothetical protein KDM91_15290, partial [Verrucomicrobiae bacterium]|nr:hypothetical protein [Verrucomicrobiae bacterium]